MSRPGKLGSLELGRFLAALMITVSHEINMLRIEPGLHAAHLLGRFDLPQPPAVDYFFVLSGFVMMTAHGHELGRPGATLRFFWRRICRIYPVYWLALCVPVFLYWRVTTVPQLLQLVTLAPVQALEYVAVAWTLRYEVAFYLMFGLVLLPRVGRIVLWLWVAATLAAWLPAVLHGLDQPFSTIWRYHVVKTPVLAHFFYIYDVLFMGGMAAGYWFRRDHGQGGWKTPAVLAALGGAAVLAGLHGSVWGFDYGPPRNFVMFTAGFGLLILGLAGLERLGLLRLGRWSLVMGQMSYPLYVVHPVVLVLVNVWILDTGGRYLVSAPTMLAGITTLTAVATVLVTFLIDQPIQRMLKFQRRHAGP